MALNDLTKQPTMNTRDIYDNPIQRAGITVTLLKPAHPQPTHPPTKYHGHYNASITLNANIVPTYTR